MVKRPAQSENPSSNKYPRTSEDVEKQRGEFLVWRVSRLDKDGKWGWSHILPEILWKNIHSKLSSFETMTLHEIINTRQHHNIAVTRLHPEAQERLKEIKQSDVDKLFSLRLSGKERVWGFLDRNILYILWWDPNHEICLSNLKHT